MSETRDQINEASAGDAAPQPVIDSTSSNVQVTMSRMSTQLQTVIDAAERAAEAIRTDAEEQARNHLAEAQRKADEMTTERVGLISGLTDDLVSHAAIVRTHSEQMIQALEEAIGSVAAKLEQPELVAPAPIESGPAQDAQGTLETVSPEEGGDAVEEAEAEAEAEVAEMEAETEAEAEVAEVEAEAEANVDEDEATAVEEVIEEAQAEPAAEAEVVEEEPEEEASPVEDAPVSEDVLLHATRLAVAGNDRDAISAALREEYGIADPEPVVRRVLGEA